MIKRDSFHNKIEKVFRFCPHCRTHLKKYQHLCAKCELKRFCPIPECNKVLRKNSHFCEEHRLEMRRQQRIARIERENNRNASYMIQTRQIPLAGYAGAKETFNMILKAVD